MIPALEDLTVPQLGDCLYPSPLIHASFVDESCRVMLLQDESGVRACLEKGIALPSFEPAGPRRRLFFNPKDVTCGIVTCGGLCPGLNNVIRSITLTLYENYGARKVYGFRYGYAGLAPDAPFPPIALTNNDVDYIQEMPGTILGSSRGPQPIEAMLATLERYGINILFAVGGDGTLRGANALAQEILRRRVPISIIGVPKTIDNDLMWITRSFGFSTAVAAAGEVLEAAHCEAKCAWNGIGLVKLMGRDSGFIAAHASIASGIVNFCLIPETPFDLEGEYGLLAELERRILRKHHAVVVVAEGAGQSLFSAGGEERDASGNVKHKDIGMLLKSLIEKHFAGRDIPVTVKYIDPSYIIRSLPASPVDAEFCAVLGQNAVHAGMAGKTAMVAGVWNNRFTHIPISAVTEKRKQVSPSDTIWQTLLNTTHQPALKAG